MKSAHREELEKIPYIDTQEQVEPEIDFSTANITQDDLWFLYRMKFGKYTRETKAKLLPKFAKLFKKELNKKTK